MARVFARAFRKFNGAGLDRLGAPGPVPLILFDLGLHIRQACGQLGGIEVEHRGQAEAAGTS
jgi:hypothetical protein